MGMEEKDRQDVEEILSHRRDNGWDLWATPDKRLMKGAPFTTLECPGYLLELGLPPEDPVLRETAELIFSVWKEDGRFRVYPAGGIYPCQTALAANVLSRMGYGGDPRVRETLEYFLDTQEPDGGWKCNKYSFGRGEETECSTPYTTLVALDLFRNAGFDLRDPRLSRAAEFLLEHWTIRRPISPCHYGIGSRFMQVEYPFRGYNLFYYVYVLSFYETARGDARFREALQALTDRTADGQIVVERAVPKLARLEFCRKGRPSERATRRYQEILRNIGSI